MVDLLDRSPPGFVDALCKRFANVLKSFWQEGEFEDEPIHTPHVHAQYMPVSTTESEERDKTKDFPVVQVICTGGVISDLSIVAQGSDITTETYFGGYRDDPDNQGWRIPVSMLWRVLQDLLENTIVGGYQLVAPIEWTPLNGREPPYYTAMLRTTWKGTPPAVESPVMDGKNDPGFGESPGNEETFESLA